LLLEVCLKKALKTIMAIIALYLCTLLAVDVGRLNLIPPEKHEGDFPICTFRMDASNYLSIVVNGYSLDKDARSTIAFFPMYPLACKGFEYVTSLHAAYAMLIVSALFYVLLLYVILQLSIPQGKNRFVFLSFLTLPATFFFRMAYAESMFCFFTALAVLGMQRRWPIWLLALLAGLATGSRPVGIAVSAAVWWYALFTTKPADIDLVKATVRQKTRPSGTLLIKRSMSMLIWLLPLSCWGLLAYMVYLWYKFDAPLAFAQTQEHWTFLAPKNYTFWDKAWSLITLEPIWNVYNPNSQRY
jgi:hypothetical protein